MNSDSPELGPVEQWIHGFARVQNCSRLCSLKAYCGEVMDMSGIGDRRERNCLFLHNFGAMASAKEEKNAQVFFVSVNETYRELAVVGRAADRAFAFHSAMTSGVIVANALLSGKGIRLHERIRSSLL